MLQQAIKHVEDNNGAGVSHVNVVVDSWTTHVNTHMLLIERHKFNLFAI